MQSKEHYQQKGREQFKTGRAIVAFGKPISWQHKHFQIGYKAAENEWREANPNKCPIFDRNK